MAKQAQPILWMKRVLKGSLAGRLFEADAEEKLNQDLYEGPFPVFKDEMKLPDPLDIGEAIADIDPERKLSHHDLGKALFDKFASGALRPAVEQLTAELDEKCKDYGKLEEKLRVTEEQLQDEQERFDSIESNFVPVSEHEKLQRLYRKMQRDFTELLQAAKDDLSPLDKDRHGALLKRCTVTLIEAGNVPDAD